MKALQAEDYEALACFRYPMRKFLSFSKQELSKAALTPEQYEAILALYVFADEGGLNIGQLSERLQVKHHTAVGLVAKLVARGLLSRRAGKSDRRQVFLQLTESGMRLLAEVAPAHREKMRQLSAEMIGALVRLQK
ncbi:MAG: MarR family transcriptional regulator [Verrucomicrobiota bacterium]|nr:MarR family transcriptional regulator [Verrucomicrobiota bacterium]